MKHTQIEPSIIQTLLYAQVFGAGVRIDQLGQFLICANTISSKELDVALAHLIKKHKVIKTGDWLMLNPRIKARELDERWWESQRKILFTKKLLVFLNFIPTVLGVAVTGSVSVGNARVDEDVDLMIVVRQGFLWSTRALINTILLMRGVLRTKHVAKVADKLCLNLWLDESSLKFERESLYVARELAQAKWIVDHSQIEARVWGANPWVKHYLANYKLGHKKTGKPSRSWNFIATIFTPIEWLVYRVQLLHMGVRTREVVGKHKAFFHPRDTQGQVLRKYYDFISKFN